MINNDFNNKELIIINSYGIGNKRIPYVGDGNGVVPTLDGIQKYKYAVIVAKFQTLPPGLGGNPPSFSIDLLQGAPGTGNYCAMKSVVMGANSFFDRKGLVNQTAVKSTVPYGVADITKTYYYFFDLTFFDRSQGIVTAYLNVIPAGLLQFDLYGTNSEAYNFFFDVNASGSGRIKQPDTFQVGDFVGTLLTIPVTQFYGVQVFYENGKIDPKIYFDNMDIPTNLYIDFVINPPTSEVKVVYS